MLDYYFTFRSITRAQQAVLVLRRYGINGVMERIPKSMSAAGCGYGVLVRSADVYQAASRLRQEGVHFENVYRFGIGGWPEEAGI